MSPAEERSRYCPQQMPPRKVVHRLLHTESQEWGGTEFIVLLKNFARCSNAPPMSLIFRLLFVVAAMCFVAHTSTRRSLRASRKMRQRWVAVPLLKIPPEKKAEALRRAFDSTYEHYDPVNWMKNL